MFCDEDTRRDASQAIRLGYVQGGFDAEDIRGKLFPLLADDVGFVYGSGFETQPQLLDEIAQRCQVFGNNAKTVRIIKDPGRFFSLLSALHIPFPETVYTPPDSDNGWFSKRNGGSGGTHVVRVPDRGGASRYYQRQVPGRPCSLLFLADGLRIRVVGYNVQLLAPLPEMPCRYGGAVSQANLPETVRRGMLHAARRMVSEWGLRGLNSLDCMVDGENWWVLEINPRLSATFSLYDAASSGARLFEAHLRACTGELPPALAPEQAQAHLIYYAPFDVTIPAAMRWPEWVADVPASEVLVETGEPLCTITAAAATADDALALAQAQAEELTRRMV